MKKCHQGGGYFQPCSTWLKCQGLGYIIVGLSDMQTIQDLVRKRFTGIMEQKTLSKEFNKEWDGRHWLQ